MQTEVCRAGAPSAGNRCGCPTRREQHSENVKSSHQFLTRFHRPRWIHSAKHLFTTLTIHSCEFAHQLIARFPFCVLAQANAEREQRGYDPNSNVSGGDEEHKRKSRFGNPNKIVLRFQNKFKQVSVSEDKTAIVLYDEPVS